MMQLNPNEKKKQQQRKVEAYIEIDCSLDFTLTTTKYLI